MYAEDDDRSQPQVLLYHFMIKGNRPDCVFYMSQVRRTRESETAEMIFTEHVCGITGYEHFASNKCEEIPSNKCAAKYVCETFIQLTGADEPVEFR